MDLRHRETKPYPREYDNGFEARGCVVIFSGRIPFSLTAYRISFFACNETFTDYFEYKSKTRY